MDNILINILESVLELRCIDGDNCWRSVIYCSMGAPPQLSSQLASPKSYQARQLSLKHSDLCHHSDPRSIVLPMRPCNCCHSGPLRNDLLVGRAIADTGRCSTRQCIHARLLLYLANDCATLSRFDIAAMAIVLSNRCSGQAVKPSNS
jgi:hypothetical protein